MIAPTAGTQSSTQSSARSSTRPTRFVSLWTLAVFATASAFILYLALRSRAVELGYQLGRARAKQAQLRETRRVLEVEAVAYRNPERIEALAKGVLQLEEPPPQRIFVVGAPIGLTEKPAIGSASAVPVGPGTLSAPMVMPTATSGMSGVSGMNGAPANALPGAPAEKGEP